MSGPITPEGWPARSLPAIDKNNHAYWTGGEHGELLIHRCHDCRYFIHPPVRFCPRCEGADVAPEAVSGLGTVITHAVSYRRWTPSIDRPYVVALVAIDEQDDVLLPCNVVHCDPETVHIGQRVRVLFEQHEDLWVPFFEPLAS